MTVRGWPTGKGIIATVVLYGLGAAGSAAAQSERTDSADETRSIRDAPASAAHGVPSATAGAREPVELVWSATVMAQGKVIAPREATDDVGGFFDQYEYTPNKGSAFPVELGVRDAAFDAYGGSGDPIFQLRLSSPTSNLGVSGRDIDQPFFNQRVETTTRLGEPGPNAPGPWRIDVDYARMRTEQLRVFPNTEGGSLIYDDLTDPDARFFRDRTGFDGTVSRRSLSLADPDRPVAYGFDVRGDFQARRGLEQRRVFRDPQNDWLGLPRTLDRNASGAGAGVLVGAARDGRWLVTVDYDHDMLRWKSPQLYESGLGVPPPVGDRPLGFVPDSNRDTARVSISGRAGSTLSWSTQYQVSVLQQVGEGTPEQRAAGLDDNTVLSQAAAAHVSWRMADQWTLRAGLDFDARDNRIDRDTPLFNPVGGVQVDPFVEDWWRLALESEVEWRFFRRNTLAVGARFDDIERSIDFAEPGGVRVLPENALIGDTTRMIDVYAKTRMRLFRTLRLDGRLGYRAAPQTGYITDLDDYVHGQLRLRQTFTTRRPLALTAFARGDWGQNDQFEMVEGLGPDPTGTSVGRTFERWTVQWGVGLEAAPVDRLSVFASFVRQCLNQQSGVVTSTLQRYFQETAALDFTDLGVDDARQKMASFVTGLNYDFSRHVDAGVAYTYTRSKSNYEGEASPAFDVLRAERRVENRTHVVDFQTGFEPRVGLRLLAGYRLQYNRDDVDAPESIASALPPIDRSTYQHTFTVGVRFDGRVLRGGD